MFEKLLDVLHDVVHPDKNWGEFTRKALTLILLSLTTFIGFDLYYNFLERSDRFIPVSEMLSKSKSVSEQVKKLMEDFHAAYPQIKGIWLYSWPDSTSLNLMHKVGQGTDPIPAGAFHPDEAADVGKLSMDICTILDRKEPNTACTIFGAGDAWGLVVVVWDGTLPIPSGSMSLIDAFANKLTHILYYQ
jgi:hypothetical protein